MFAHVGRCIDDLWKQGFYISRMLSGLCRSPMEVMLFGPVVNNLQLVFCLCSREASVMLPPGSHVHHTLDVLPFSRNSFPVHSFHLHLCYSFTRYQRRPLIVHQLLPAICVLHFGYQLPQRPPWAGGTVCQHGCFGWLTTDMWYGNELGIHAVTFTAGIFCCAIIFLYDCCAIVFLYDCCVMFFEIFVMVIVNVACCWLAVFILVLVAVVYLSL